jgi:hypothetical protein
MFSTGSVADHCMSFNPGKHLERVLGALKSTAAKPS